MPALSWPFPETYATGAGGGLSRTLAADFEYQRRSILSSFVKSQVLHASERSSKSQTNRIGVIRTMTISVPHFGHMTEALLSGGNSWTT